jgi:hypothetical protein
VDASRGLNNLGGAAQADIFGIFKGFKRKRAAIPGDLPPADASRSQKTERHTNFRA